ncbi:YciI family protein [Corynebacterium uropygiale]|uniref:YciI family protein n=1 Tax=Corynebacterium uropygiale TaxID=1775911 RepID=A0A9X1QSP0_9CORY|nr:YciI family protein [Corynebacterium uropygiale]MCF4007495.1 YciI family protein [Corynebacterium uropygiale]
MSLFAVQYFYAGDPDAMAEVRPTHVEFLRSLHESGALRVSGPADGGTSALLIFQAESKEELEKTLNEDPFWTAGFIGERPIREWNPFFGSIN